MKTLWISKRKMPNIELTEKNSVLVKLESCDFIKKTDAKHNACRRSR